MPICPRCGGVDLRIAAHDRVTGVVEVVCDTLGCGWSEVG